MGNKLINDIFSGKNWTYNETIVDQYNINLIDEFPNKKSYITIKMS